MVARALLCLYSSNYPTQFEKRQFSGYPAVKEFMKKGCPKFRFDKFKHETNPLLVHSKVYAIADKYDMPGLQAICLRNFQAGMGTVGYRENLVDTLPHIYSSTPLSQTALRQKAAALVKYYSSEIMNEQSLKTKLETACVESGQLAWDILSNVIEPRRASNF
jgi:hypothetical protein